MPTTAPAYTPPRRRSPRQGRLRGGPAHDGAIVPDPEQIITGGHDNTTARTVAVRRGEEVNAPALLAMFAAIIANNPAGGWRKIKRA